MSTKLNYITQEGIHEGYLDFGPSSGTSQGQYEISIENMNSELEQSAEDTKYQIYYIKEEDWKGTSQESSALLSDLIGAVQSSTDKDVVCNPIDLPETLREQMQTSLDQLSVRSEHVEASETSRDTVGDVFRKETSSHVEGVSKNICTTSEGSCGSLINTTSRNEIGPFLSECGLTLSDLSNPVQGRILNIKVGLVLEIVDHIPSHNARETAKLLVALSHQNSSIHNSQSDSLRKKIAEAVKKRKQIKRSKASELHTFLNKEFVPPVTFPPSHPPTPASRDTVGDFFRKEISTHVEGVSKNICTTSEGSCGNLINTSSRNEIDPEKHLENSTVNSTGLKNEAMDNDEDLQTVSSVNTPDISSDQHSKDNPRFVAILQLATYIRNCQGIVPFECIICNEKFDARSQLVQHMLTHKNKKAHKCSECNMEFHSKSDLVKHLESHRVEKPWCSLCNKSFAAKYTLLRHMKIHTRKELHKALNSKAELTIHVKTHIRKKPYSCSECKRKFTAQNRLASHMRRTHTEKTPHKCSYCTEAFNTKIALMKHIKTHNINHPCAQCDEIFDEKSKLIQHMRVHNEGKPHQCSECHKKYNYRSRLNSHMNVVHTGEKPYQCSECHKRFYSPSDLNRHMRTHSGEKPYHCSKCKKRYKHPGDLSRHMMIHTGEKPHKCSECKKSFPEKSKLTRHMRIHTGEQPYQCSECDRRFSFKSALTCHKRLHAGEKPHSCSYCKEAFISKDALVRHVQIHTGEKSFPCSQCIKRFVCKPDLTSHMKMHTKPYKCSECKKGFSSKYGLKKHMKTHT